MSCPFLGFLVLSEPKSLNREDDQLSNNSFYGSRASENAFIKTRVKILLASTSIGSRMESLEESEMIPERKLLLFYVLIALAISPLDSMRTTSLQLRNRLEPSPGLDEDICRTSKSVKIVNHFLFRSEMCGKKF